MLKPVSIPILFKYCYILHSLCISFIITQLIHYYYNIKLYHKNKAAESRHEQNLNNRYHWGASSAGSTCENGSHILD